MINKYERIIIDKLLGKYEKSKSFIGENLVKQKFSLKPAAIFSKYTDHANYEEFNRINEAIDFLVRKEFIIGKANASKEYNEVVLNLEKLEEAYEYLGKIPKKDINQSVLQLIEKYSRKNEILKSYFDAQLERIGINKPIQFFNNDLLELENVLEAVEELMKVNTETYLRDFSVRVFRDSKIFELISSKVVNLLYEFGDFPEKDQILGNLNIIKNPTYVNFKGAGIVTIKNQRIDLSVLRGDIAISTSILSDIDKIEVIGKGVITVENLTSFHTFSEEGMFIIYLGGYHNRIRSKFIKKIHEQNPAVLFYHFGDIDAGGFYIFEHLKKKTGIEFKAYKMDVDTLKEFYHYSKKLSDNDRNRLLKLKDSQFNEVISYMLDNNCKLEQEAINVKYLE